jgi:ATP-dependent Lon protease
MFITTANVRYNIPLPLQDRMEIIELPGYLQHEKLQIAKRHIFPKQLKLHGLEKYKINVLDEAIMKIITDYTREAGVRNLERELASVFRKTAKEIVLEKGKNGRKSKTKLKFELNPEKIESFLGVPKFRSQKAEKKPRIGSITGLAWTSVGGEILNVDATVMSGPEKLIITGQIGDVMKESAQAALSYIRSNTKDFGLKANFHKGKEIHIHLPEGAIPKDGPSAGITLALAMFSAFSGRPAKADVAMTGEITLRGNVLAIGGLSEKLIAAKRSGIKKVLIPKDNEKDLAEVKPEIKENLSIIPIENIKDAIKYVFTAQRKKTTKTIYKKNTK